MTVDGEGFNGPLEASIDYLLLSQISHLPLQLNFINLASTDKQYPLNRQSVIRTIKIRSNCGPIYPPCAFPCPLPHEGPIFPSSSSYPPRTTSPLTLAPPPPPKHPTPLYQQIMSSYQMKKALRRSAGAPKSYAEHEQQAQPQQGSVQNRQRLQREMSRESIFEHKNWTVKEKVRLMIFLGHYHGLPDWGSERKSIHLYKHLSTFLKKTRTPEQCKNIHSLLKRKFASLQEVVDAMQAELETEDNYEKIATKYEREIEKFEAENRLFEGVAEERKGFEPLRSKRVTEREERDCEVKVNVGRSKEEEEDLKINLNEYIKCEEQAMGGALAQRRDELVRSCNLHFQEWLKCIRVLEFKNEKQIE